MKYPFHLLFTILFFTACQESVSNQDPYAFIDSEIAQLDTDEKWQAYWEEIGKSDQQCRSDETFVLQKYGHDTKEHQEAWQKIRDTDALNLAKAKKLIVQKGFPQKEVLGAKAVTAAFLTFHHASEYEERIWAFPYFYKAYKTDNLKEGPFSFYLNRTYSTKMGKRYEVGDVFKEEDRIKGIIEELGLEK